MFSRMDQSKIKGQIGESLKDDIDHIRRNSLTLETLVGSDPVTNDNSLMKTVFSSALLVRESDIVLNTILEVTNTGQASINFMVVNLDTEVYQGIIQPGKILSLNSDRTDIRVSTDGACKVNYTIRYLKGGS